MAPEKTPTDACLVDLFAGPGGLDVAATWLGIRSLGVEWDDDACATREAAGLHTRQSDVRELAPSDFPGGTLLAAGPPCQTYTVAGSGSGRRALHEIVEAIDRMSRRVTLTDQLISLPDERTGLVLEPLRWALEALQTGVPYEAVVLEQVPQVLPIWQATAAALRRHGYRTAVGILRTEQFGVPQTRRRAILLAHRSHQPHLPVPTHESYRRSAAREEQLDRLLPCVAMDQVVDRAGPFVAISNYGTGGDPSARGRRASTEPAATVTSKIRRVRLEGKRIKGPLDRLSYSEAGRLQTFPGDYPWSGRDLGQQIGNAIPPRLAAHALAAVLRIDLPRGFLDNKVNSSWEVGVAGELTRSLPSIDETSRHLAVRSISLS